MTDRSERMEKKPAEPLEAPVATAKVEGWPRKIRTTMEPWKELEVQESEFLDLAARGLIKGEEKK